jgi:hypothetical protein
MLTGLEAYATYCEWYPDQNSSPNRIVEGFYILTDMPCIGRNHRGIIKHLEPAEFSSDTKNAILNLMGAVYDLRDVNDPKHPPKSHFSPFFFDFWAGVFCESQLFFI